MKLPRVINLRDEGLPVSAVYVGRPSAFGNPFKVGPGCSNRQAVDKFRDWLFRKPELVAKVRRELKGRELACWCWPRPCHADVLRRVAAGCEGPHAHD